MVLHSHTDTRPEPLITPVWKGSFNILHKEHDILNGLTAHLSTNACQKVNDEAHLLQPVLHLQMLPKSEIWPKSFQTLSESTAENIQLYFFPSHQTSEILFDRLVDKMMQDKVGLRAVVHSAELLVFPSNELPMEFTMFQGKYYLWGVFTEKQAIPSHSQLVVRELGNKIGNPSGDKPLITT